MMKETELDQIVGALFPTLILTRPLYKARTCTRGILLLIHRAFYIEISKELKDKNNMGIIK